MKNTPQDLVLPQFQTITANQVGLQTITASAPCRWAYWSLDFFPTGFGALTAAQILACIQEIRVKANDLIIQRLSGTELNTINQYYKMPAFAVGGVLSLMQRKMGVRGGVQGLAPNPGGNVPVMLYSGSAADVALETILNTGSENKAGQAIQSLVVEIDLVNTPVGTPQIQWRAQVTDKFPGGAGLMRVLSKTPFQAAISTNNTLQKNQGLAFGDEIHSKLPAFYLFPQGGGTLDNFTLRYNNNPIIQRSAAYNTFLQNLDFLRTPQATMTVIEFSPNGYGDEVLSIEAQDTDLQFVYSDTAAEVVNVIEEAEGYFFGKPS